MASSSSNAFWEMFYIKGFDNKDQILLEALRVVKTYRYVLKNKINVSDVPEDKENLFKTMKKVSEDNKLGHFPGDRDFFYDIFSIASGLDLLQLLSDANKSDRTGLNILPDYLLNYFEENFLNLDSKVLIAGAEKMIDGLAKIINNHSSNHFTLTCENHLISLLLSTYFEEKNNVKVINQSLYRELLIEDSFDVVFCVPSFGGKLSLEETSKNFLTRESECIAIENLIKRINENGKLVSVLPAKITFASGQIAEFRKWILKNYSVDYIYSLPEGIFRPYSGVKTYLMVFGAKIKENFVIGEITDEDFKLVLSKKVDVSINEFKSFDDWRVEIYITNESDEIQKFKASKKEKIKLKDFSDIFRGKSILKYDVKPGKIHVLNISNIENGQVVFEDMDTINDEERKVKRYQLEKDDIVLTCRGTLNKVAVFPETQKVVIASANIIVIRIKEKILAKYLKIFLDSSIGEALIKSFQRGTNVMNINPNDIGELEVPLVPLEKQEDIISRFEMGFSNYLKKREQIEQDWINERINIYENFINMERVLQKH